jgi:hypothetical protein
VGRQGEHLCSINRHADLKIDLAVGALLGLVSGLPGLENVQEGFVIGSHAMVEHTSMGHTRGSVDL